MTLKYYLAEKLILLCEREGGPIYSFDNQNTTGSLRLLFSSYQLSFLECKTYFFLEF